MPGWSLTFKVSKLTLFRATMEKVTEKKWKQGSRPVPTRHDISHTDSKQGQKSANQPQEHHTILAG